MRFLQLYENFSEPYKLLECQLAIIDCAGYTDSVLIESIWQQILSDEIQKSSGSGNDRVNQVLTKVKHLARKYAHSSHCFPLGNVYVEYFWKHHLLTNQWTNISDIYKFQLSFFVFRLYCVWAGNSMCEAEGWQIPCTDDFSFHEYSFWETNNSIQYVSWIFYSSFRVLMFFFFLV